MNTLLLVYKLLISAASGEYSDFQAVCNKMDEVKRNQFIFDDGHQYGPKNYGKYLCNHIVLIKLNYAMNEETRLIHSISKE